MWKLQKAYFSDFVAGKHYLDDGLLELLDEAGDSKDALIFAENGTFKSTLLSLLMSTLVPDKKRFIQSLQSDGDKVMDDYVIPGRPALILLKFVDSNTKKPDMFGDYQLDSLVIGQLFQLKKAETDEPDLQRTFFISRDANAFSELRKGFLASRGERNGVSNIRQLMSELGQVETVQRDWLKELKDAGIDTFILDKQVDFSKDEGGLAKSLTFKSEEDFLSFFLGATIDTQKLEQVYQAVLEGMDSHKELPKRVRELKAALKIEELMQEFAIVGGKWRSHDEAFYRLREEQAEAAYIVGEALPQVEAQKNQFANAAEKCSDERNKALTDVNIARADNFLLNQAHRSRECAEAEANLNRIQNTIDTARSEKTAIEGADYRSKRLQSKRDSETAEIALRAANAELSPLQDHVNDCALAFHSRIKFEQKTLNDDKKDLEQKEIQNGEDKQKLKDRIDKEEEAKKEKEEKLIKARQGIKQAELARDMLPLEQGESVDMAETRLEQTATELEQHFDHLKKRSERVLKSVDEIRSEEGRVGEALSDAKTTLSLKVGWLEEESKERAKIQKNETLAVIAGSVEFDPYSSQLGIDLADTITRRKAAADSKQEELLGRKAELERLQNLTNLSEDENVRDLLKFYHSMGVSGGKVRSFTEYLDTMSDGDAERIGALMASDPARFGGLMATDEVVLEQLRSIETPDWLLRPVVISLPDDMTATDNDHLVITPKDVTVYSPKALQRRIEVLNDEFRVETQKLEERKDLHDEACQAQAIRQGLLDRFVSKEHIEAVLQEKLTLEATISRLETTLKELANSLSEKNEETKAIEEKKTELTGQSQDVNTHRTLVKNWLSQYSQLNQWQVEKSQLAEELVKAKDTIQSLTEELEQVGKQTVENAKRLQACDSQLIHLSNQAILVQRPSGDLPSPADASLVELQQSYEKAHTALIKAAAEQNISELENKHTECQQRLSSDSQTEQRYFEQHGPDEALVAHWLGVSSIERAEAVKDIGSRLIELMADEKHERGRIEDKSKALIASKASLQKHLKQHQIEPTLSEEELLECESLNVIKQTVSERLGRAEKLHEELENRSKQLQKRLSAVENYFSNLSHLAGRLEDVEPNVGNDGFQRDWPELGIGLLEEQVAACEAMDTAVSGIKQELKNANTVAQRERQKLNSAFERIKKRMEADDICIPLQAMVDTLLTTDVERFARQIDEHINECGNVLRSIKMEMDIAESGVERLVNMLMEHAQDCNQVLEMAGQALVPQRIPVYSGMKILSRKRSLDFTRHRDTYSEALKSWFLYAADTGKLPQANEKVGDGLGASLLYKLLKCTSQRGHDIFDIGLVKLDGQSGQYTPITKNLSSGGEGLAAGTLLYSVVCSVRSQQRQHLDAGRGLAMLALDNPLSKANKASLVQAQLATCEAFGLQPVFFTGIGDVAAIEQFARRILITKVEKNEPDNSLKVGDKNYRRVRVTESHLHHEALSA